jgi:hypothetical protein
VVGLVVTSWLFDLSHGYFGEIMALGDGPVVVLFDEDGADEAHDRGVVGDDAHDVGAALELLADSRGWWSDLAPVGSGEGGVGGHVALGGGEEFGGLGELAFEDPDDLVALGPSRRLTEELRGRDCLNPPTTRRHCAVIVSGENFLHSVKAPG